MRGRVLIRSFLDFFRDDGMVFAGSISFFVMMAIVPFCLFLVAMFGYSLGENQEFYRFFLSKLVSFFPRITSEITEELKRLITYRGVGKFSLALYALLSFQLFSSLESAINRIFKIRQKRAVVVSMVLSLVIVTLVMGFLVISFGATSAVSMLKTLSGVFPGIEIGEITGFLIRFVIPLLLVFLIGTTLYLFLPRSRVKLLHAMEGALFMAVFLEAAKHLFTLYVVKVVRLGTIYGPLSAFIIFLLWVYYSSCIFLVGAEVVHNLGAMRERRR